MKNSEIILAEPGTTQIMEIPVPTPKDGEVLIKVACVGICGSDIHSFASGPFIPPVDPKQKIGMGHECSGTVIAVGPYVTNFKQGDRVCIEPGVPCGKCRYCREGKYNICPDMDFMATQPNYKGALTKYLCYPADFTYHLPDNISMIEGALVEPAAVGMHAAMLAKVKPGMRVAILGAGCIGLMVLQACHYMGIRDISISDVLPSRLSMAKQLGASMTVNSAEKDASAACRAFWGGDGADVVFETAGNTVTAKQTLKVVGRGGKILIVGTIPGETSVDFLSINREVSLQTVFRYANCFPATIEAIVSGAFDVRSMVTHQYAYEESQRAFEESVNLKQKIIKSVIRVSE